MKLKDIRLQKGLTQQQSANILGVSRKTYIKYENDNSLQNNLKYRFMCQVLNEYGYIDENTGILTLETIKTVCASVFKEYEVEFCYLFGSYAKNKATPTSDVDLLISTKINGLKYFGLIETLRENLKKRVDLLDLSQLNNNPQLVAEILKDGVKIYG